MAHICHYCEKQAESAHSITVYRKDGVEDHFEVLCGDCYSDWLLSLKG